MILIFNLLKGADIHFKYADNTNIVITLWKDGVDQSPEVMAIFYVGLKKKIHVM